jgi:hypothetical protein
MFEQDNLRNKLPSLKPVTNFKRPVFIQAVSRSHRIVQMFSLFQKLPTELRSQIWLAAMPQPRLVHLQERITEKYNSEEFNPEIVTQIWDHLKPRDESDYQWLDKEDSAEVDFEDVQDEWDSRMICNARTTIPALHKIDPGLKYFRQVLGPVARRRNEKWLTQLERYGFTSSIPKPELPMHILTDCSDSIDYVFHATRRGYIWSSCPIPALLQTCQESRQMMLLAGYELTFRTRTSGPRTWFNFRHNTLYLTPDQTSWGLDYYGSESLDGGPWNIGQLASGDLNRVKNLALADAFNFQPKCLLTAVRLFGNLKELLLVFSHQQNNNEQMKYHPSQKRDNWGHIEHEKDLWGYIDFEEADMNANVPFYQNRGSCARSFLFDICTEERRLREYRHFRSGVSWGFWPELVGETEEWLQRRNEGTLTKDGIPWRVPKVRIVQVVTKAQVKDVLWSRYLYTTGIIYEAENEGDWGIGVDTRS